MKRVLLAAVLCVSAPMLAMAAEGTPQDPLTHGSVEAGSAKSATCTACHGPGGNSANPEWPKLAGQSARYISEQLHRFKAGERQNPLMQPQAAALSDEDKGVLDALDQDDWVHDAVRLPALRRVLMEAAAYYYLRAKTDGGRPVDPVARFHLGNGARLERLNWLGDASLKGLKQAHGLMVNYLYDLDDIEKNHEAFVNKGRVAAASSVRGALRADLPAREPAPAP